MINTHGFQVQEMPRYVPADPNLIASHPENINRGILQSFQIASDDAKLQAFKAQQDEINQLRADRMAAARAVYQHRATKEQALKSLVPAQTAVTSGQLSGQLQAMPYFNSKIVEDAKTGAELAPYESDLRIGKAQIGRDIMQQTAPTQIATGVKQAENAGQAADIAGQTMGPTAAANLERTKALAEQMNARAEEYKAMAAYKRYQATNPKADQTTFEVMRKANADDNKQAARIGSGSARQVDANGNEMTINQYYAATRNPDGSIKPGAATNAYAEAQLEEQQQLVDGIQARHQHLKEITDRQAGVKPAGNPEIQYPGAAGTAGVAAPPVNPAVNGLELPAYDLAAMNNPAVEEAYQHLQDHPDDPNAAAILAGIQNAMRQHPDESIRSQLEDYVPAPDTTAPDTAAPEEGTMPEPAAGNQ